MIDDYFQHLFNREPSKSVIIGANKQKSFYEDLVQIGTKDDTGVGAPDAEVDVACLKEYMEGFQKRNPNLYVFNAVMHLNEATPPCTSTTFLLVTMTEDSISGMLWRKLLRK